MDENTIVYGLRKRRLHTISVLLRFSPYTDQYDRIQPFTEFVTFDLGMFFVWLHQEIARKNVNTFVTEFMRDYQNIDLLKL
jgi:hypothetical protein